MSQPLTHSEFSSIMSNHFFLLEKKPHVALSFSGGSDSLALLILLNSWIKKRDGILTLIHFNHKLRKESYLEAVFTKKLSKKFNLNFKILNWDNEKPKSAIMFKARHLRYKKIIDFCKKQKIITLMTAHHHNDSLETYLMRKERKFSTLGLAGIPTRNNRDNVQILRPLINIGKERLIKTCNKYKYKWIEDSSNKNHRFERIRIRNSITNFSKKEKSKIINDFNKCKKENYGIERKIGEFFVDNLKFQNFGEFLVDKQKFIDEPKSNQIEIMKKILVTCSGGVYPPRTRSITLMLKQIEKLKRLNFTINSCVIELNKKSIHFFREYQKIKREIKKETIVRKGTPLLWDDRFEINSMLSDLKCFIFDDSIWIKIKKDFNFIRLNKKINYRILKTLPVLQIKRKIMIPFLSDEKEMLSNGVSVIFSPKIPLTKKNF